MNKVLPLLLLPLLLLDTAGCAKAKYQTYGISANVFGQPLTITTNESFAGGINSISLGAFEYLTQYDHGRGMQSTFRTARLGECFNPTEAGSRSDYADGPPSSVLLNVYTNKNYMRTKTQMAYWLSTTDNYVANCPTGAAAARTAKNLSNETVSKQITIGIKGHENVILLEETFYIAETNLNDVGLFEGITNYANGQLSQAYTLSPNGLVHQNGSGAWSTDQKVPIVVSTADKQHAIGSIMLEIPSSSISFKYVFARFVDNYANNELTTIWSNVFFVSLAAQGNYNFKTYLVVGTLSQVEQTMLQLQRGL